MICTFSRCLAPINSCATRSFVDGQDTFVPNFNALCINRIQPCRSDPRTLRKFIASVYNNRWLLTNWHHYFIWLDSFWKRLVGSWDGPRPIMWYWSKQFTSYGTALMDKTWFLEHGGLISTEHAVRLGPFSTRCERLVRCIVYSNLAVIQKWRFLQY